MNKFVALLPAFFFMFVPAFAQQSDRYVSPKGNDRWPGSQDRPWKTLEHAVGSIAKIEGDVRLVVGDGEYSIARPLELKGSSGRRIIIEAAQGEAPVIRGDRRISAFKPVKDRTVLTRLSKEARSRVLEADLKAAGVGEFGNPCKRENLMDLYWKGKRQQLARYPNDGFMKSGRALGQTVRTDNAREEGIFEYLDDRISLWADEKDAWIFGYYHWDWSDSYQKVGSIDKEKKVISLAEPWDNYGFKDGFRYYGLNLLCELDSPGEYYIDREKGKLYWFPQEDYSIGDEVTVSLYKDKFMLRIEDCKDVEVKGLAFVGGRENAVSLEKVCGVLLKDLGVSCFGGDALHVIASKDVKVDRCRFETLGHSGIQSSGGNRKTLEPADYSIKNTVIKDFSLFKHTYEPAVHFSGCGLTVAPCDFSGSSSSAMRIDGSEALVEFNHFHDLVKESDDQGGIDMFFNYGYRGVVIRYNLWEDILGGSVCGAAGVRFDDMISDQLVYGNIFRNVGALLFGAVQIHGGKDNVVDNNVFYECNAAVSFSPWSQENWDRYVDSDGVRKQLYEDVDIDGQLYRDRYPKLKEDIRGNLNRNVVKNNLAIGCKSMYYRENGQNILQNNSALFIGENAELQKPLKYYLDPDVLAGFGLKPIPYEQIGVEGSPLEF